MNILIISGFFYPTNTPRSFRTTELAKELCRQGHNITVCVPRNDYDYSDFLNLHHINLDFLDIGEDKKISFNGSKIVVLLKKIYNRIRSTYFQYPDIKYVWKIPKYLKSKGNFDAIISIAVPHPIHWGVEKAISNNSNVTKVWIADCGDPFMLCKTDTFRKPFYFKFFEKAFCKAADFITIPVSDGKDGYYPEFHHKIKVIPQGFDFSDIRIVQNFEPNDIITFGYAGGFIPGLRDPRPILDFLKNVEADFRFYIYTNQLNLVEPYKRVLGDKLILSGYIDRTELIYRMSSFDFLLNIENGTSVQSPSKLIDYSLTKRPVLSIYSQNLDTGKFYDFLNRNYERKMELPDVNCYNIKNVAASFLNLIEEKK